jgi:formamidopyrimidine-DNA glycosylase
MPELPEVETIARKLRPELVGKSIAKADLLWPRTLDTPTPEKFRKQIKGQEIQSVGRRGKFFVIQLSYYYLFVHLRMSGDLYIKEEKAPTEQHDRLILTLTSGPSPNGGGENSPLPAGDGLGVRASKLVFNDTRKFGRVWLVRDPDEVISALGPEPLSEEIERKP